MQFLPFRSFFLRKTHQELGGLKDQVLLGKEVQQENRDGDQVAKEDHNKDTMNLTDGGGTELPLEFEMTASMSTNPFYFTHSYLLIMLNDPCFVLRVFSISPVVWNQYM